jgi:hypothetical protein
MALTACLGGTLPPGTNRQVQTLTVGAAEPGCFQIGLNPLGFAEAASLMTLKVFALSAVTGH